MSNNIHILPQTLKYTNPEEEHKPITWTTIRRRCSWVAPPSVVLPCDLFSPSPSLFVVLHSYSSPWQKSHSRPTSIVGPFCLVLPRAAVSSPTFFVTNRFGAHMLFCHSSFLILAVAEIWFTASLCHGLRHLHDVVLFLGLCSSSGFVYFRILGEKMNLLLKKDEEFTWIK